MARIKDSTVEAVRRNADFVGVVEERTALRKAGARLVGRCPFHDERTASFSVNPVEKLYHCFGCGAGGDMIGFVRETQGLGFVEAVEWLAGRSGIVAEYDETSEADDHRRKRRERLLALLDDAASFYERYLWDSPAGSLARDYLAGRGIGEEVAREFRLGLALGGTTLTRKALDKGFTAEELRATGLTRPRGGDYFERRLLFPLSDARGRVLGFQARRLHEDDPLQAKYVNTPESALFTKGAVVYGLDKARAAISKTDRACVVEGNTDVIALRQAGFQPVVACMGTALTEDQLRELGRLTKRLFLAFDGDAAGESATLRGMELAVKQGFDVKVVALPPGGWIRLMTPRASSRGSPPPSRTRSTAHRSKRAGRRIPRQAAVRSRRSSRPCPSPTTGGMPGAGPTTTSACRSRSAVAEPRVPVSPRRRRSLRPPTRSSAALSPV